MTKPAQLVIFAIALLSTAATFVGVAALLPTYGPLDWVEYGFFALVAVIIGGLCALIGYFVVDAMGLLGVRRQQAHGTITAKYYTPSQTSTGVGVGIAPGTGQPSTVVTTHHHPEQFTVEIIMDETGEKMRYSVEQENFDALSEGDRVVLAYRISKTTGHIHWDDTILPEKTS